MVEALRGGTSATESQRPMQPGFVLTREPTLVAMLAASAPWGAGSAAWVEPGVAFWAVRRANLPEGRTGLTVTSVADPQWQSILRVVQHQETGMFLKVPGRWVRSFRQATKFATTEEAVSVVQGSGTEGARWDIVLRFEEDEPMAAGEG